MRNGGPAAPLRPCWLMRSQELSQEQVLARRKKRPGASAIAQMLNRAGPAGAKRRRGEEVGKAWWMVGRGGESPSWWQSWQEPLTTGGYVNPEYMPIFVTESRIYSVAQSAASRDCSTISRSHPEVVDLKFLATDPDQVARCMPSLGLFAQ